MGSFERGHLEGVFQIYGVIQIYEAFRFVKASRIRGSFRFYESYVSTCNLEVVLIQQRKTLNIAFHRQEKESVKRESSITIRPKFTFKWKYNY